ncbi:hypothetical protein HPB50_012319 [Hyalomma asiaticum]|uniref:Uncharacterized protein n=1 Tax=Hyalomma asiaticum TaxID=266040 RepID=A0ACB7SHA4_HYAAI|nr:hypothetical protein HPB50_012319 [Hyalomma asiaticum]
MAQSAVSNTIHEVTEAIISVAARRKLVDFPLTPVAKGEAKAAFAELGYIPGVLACVDGTLVAIGKPQGRGIGTRRASCRGRVITPSTAWFSPTHTPPPPTNTAVRRRTLMFTRHRAPAAGDQSLDPWRRTWTPGSPVRNADLRILVVDPRFPGSCHDSGVAAKRAACMPSSATVAWRICACPERTARIIYACAALHNIALDSGDRTLEELGGGVPPPEQPEEPGGGQALEPRDMLLRGRHQFSAVVNLF